MRGYIPTAVLKGGNLWWPPSPSPQGVLNCSVRNNILLVLLWIFRRVVEETDWTFTSYDGLQDNVAFLAVHGKEVSYIQRVGLHFVAVSRNILTQEIHQFARPWAQPESALSLMTINFQQIPFSHCFWDMRWTMNSRWWVQFPHTEETKTQTERERERGGGGE